MYVGSRANIVIKNMALRRLATEAEHIDRFFVSNLISKALVNTHQMVYIYTKDEDCNGAKLVSCKKEEFEIASLRINEILKETVPENIPQEFLYRRGKEQSEEHWNHLHCPIAPLVQWLLC
jgi:hypothetical protein